MACLFYKNPRVVAIRGALNDLRIPTDISWIVAQYAWHSENYNLSLALRDLSRADGSGRIFLGDGRRGFLKHACITWGVEEPDYEKKVYTLYTGINSHQLQFSQMFPDSNIWLPRRHSRMKTSWDIIKERYITIVKAAFQKYAGLTT